MTQLAESTSGKQILDSLIAEAWSPDHAPYRKALDNAVASIRQSVDTAVLDAPKFEAARVNKLKDVMRSKVVTAVWEDQHVKGFVVNATELANFVQALKV